MTAHRIFNTNLQHSIAYFTLEFDVVGKNPVSLTVFNQIYIHLYSRQEATAHMTKIETEKNKVTYMNR